MGSHGARLGRSPAAARLNLHDVGVVSEPLDSRSGCGWSCGHSRAPFPRLRASKPLAVDGLGFSVATAGSEKADAVPSGRGNGAQDWEERGAYFWGTHRPRRRAVFSRPFRASVTSQSAVGEAVRRILSGRSKDFLTVPIVYGIHFPAMQSPLFHRSPARKVLGAQRRRVGGLARARRSGLGTGSSPEPADRINGALPEPRPNRPFKNASSRSRRGNEAQMSSETEAI